MTDVAHHETSVRVSTSRHTAPKEVMDRRRYSCRALDPDHHVAAGFEQVRVAGDGHVSGHRTYAVDLDLPITPDQEADCDHHRDNGTDHQPRSDLVSSSTPGFEVGLHRTNQDIEQCQY